MDNEVFAYQTKAHDLDNSLYNYRNKLAGKSVLQEAMLILTVAYRGGGFKSAPPPEIPKISVESSIA